MKIKTAYRLFSRKDDKEKNVIAQCEEVAAFLNQDGVYVRGVMNAGSFIIVWHEVEPKE
jgi:hypothetical protein